MMVYALEADLLLKYPLIISFGDCKYEGFIEIKVDVSLCTLLDSYFEDDILIKTALFLFNISQPLFLQDKTHHINLKVLEGTETKFLLEINETLQDFVTHIKNLSKRTDLNVVAYLDELTSIISTVPTDAKRNKLKFDTQTWQTVLNEYYEFRQFYINIHKATLSSNLREITIEHQDSKNRTHRITVEVNYEDEKEKLFKIVNCDVPDFNLLQSQSEEALAILYEKFIAKIECPKLQMIFDMLEEIDRNCWVLDPEKPSRKDLYRRIMLGENISAVITFNASDIRDLPQIKFLGPRHAVRKYAAILSENVDKWDTNENILQGLLNLLGMSAFPLKPKHSETGELLVNEGECCVCFSMRLNGKLPEIVCSNQSCSKYFHVECLYQSLCLLNPRKLGSEIIGQCPNCEKTIHCSMLMEQNRLL